MPPLFCKLSTMRIRRLQHLERLESRILPAINIVYDYTYDSTGFFNAYERRATMEAAARLFEDAISDTLNAITPGGVNGWTASFPNPSTGSTVNLNNLSIPAGELRVFLGARALAGGTIGLASSGWSASGTSTWLTAVQYRGQAATATEYANWGGSIAFDSGETWHNEVTVTGLSSGESDLYSTAIHELAHLLGYGGDSWDNYVSGGLFTGPVSVGVFGGSVPAAGGHWDDGVQNDGSEAAMSPSGLSGVRNPFTTLDFAGLDDIGWGFISGTNPPGHLVVQVVDAAGNPVSGASVSGQRTGGGTFSGTTDANGLYTRFVADGTWTVTMGNASQNAVVNKGMTAVRLVDAPLPNYEEVILRDAVTGRFRIGYSDGVTFTETLANTLSPETNWQILTGDFNGDGRIDTAARMIQNGMWWVEVSGASSLSGFWADWDETKTWSDVGVGDFNGDGKDDIAGRDQDGNWIVSRSLGGNFITGGFGKWAATGWQQVLYGDFNGDGRSDVAGRYTQGDWFFGLSSGSAFATTRVGKWSNSGGWKDIRVGDFDGDGDDDLAGQTSSGYWWIGQSSGTALTNIYSGVRWNPTAGFHTVLVGDFNGDGRSDLAGRTAAGSWFINLAKTPSAGFTVSAWGTWTNTLVFHTVVGDFNGDGMDDLAGFVESNRYWFVLQSNGSRFDPKNFGRWTAGLDVDYLGAGPVNGPGQTVPA